MASPAPTSSAAWYALRRTLPVWSFAENLRELTACLPRYGVDELVVKVDTEEFSHGQVPLDWARAYQPKLLALRDALAEIGVAYSLNPWITVGHCDRGRDGRAHVPHLRPMVGHDGTECTCCACPLSTAWREHTTELWTLYAQTQPRVLWVEDDIRTFNHEPIKFGCFCSEHLARFGVRVGRPVTRPELVAALLQPGTPHPWRQLFLDLQSEIMNETVAFLAQIVHRVSPTTSLGLMSSGPRQHCLEGRRWAPFARALADGATLYSRPPLANYWEESLRGFYYSHDSIKITRHCLPPDTVEQTEVENIPFTRYSKSTAFTFLQMAISFAYGSQGVTLNLFDHAGTPMENEPAFGRLLAEKKPLLNALAAHASRPGAYRGVQLVFDESASHHRQLRPGAGYGELAADGEPAMTLLETHGIPTTYSPERVAVAMGQQLRGFSDVQLLALLGRDRGLLLDATAARTLCERGFGELIGVESIAPAQMVDDLPSRPLVAEELHHPDFGGADKRLLTLTLPNLMSRPSLGVLAPAPSARVVSHFVDPEGRRIHPGATAYENRLGGRVYVHALDWATSYGVAFNHPFRAAQLQTAVRWLSRDAAPLLVSGDGVYPLAFRKDLPSETLLGLFNLSLDPWQDTQFTLADTRQPLTPLLLSADGHWQESPLLSLAPGTSGHWRLSHGGRIPFDAPLFVRIPWAASA
ncbi:MAG: hypothetical protein HZA31_08550 [Opitutae bacterium]|nr:hypothetical protein [Opitutae bacterium]